MTPDDFQRIQALIEKWQRSEGNEQANSQPFFLDLCAALGVSGPPPKDSSGSDTYSFEKAIKTFSEKGQTSKRADFYKEGCFLLEAKQGSFSSNKGHGKRGTKIYEDVMQGAFNQARQYIQLIDSPTKPPFLITCDIGYRFDIWEGFSGEYGSYGARRRVSLAELQQPEVFDRFVKIFTDPQSLNPEKLRAKVTREVAAELAKLSRWLEDQGHDPQTTASFLMRCIFTMFAEDVELLKGEVFTKALRDRWIPYPETFQPEIEQLWQTMNTGGSFGFERVLQFNGSFFENATAIALPAAQLKILLDAAEKDWKEVEPAIFGTLVERALEKKERSRLGAHYTPRSYVERLVRPVVMEPLRQEWDDIELEVKRLLEPEAGKEDPTPTQRKKAEQEIRAFLDKLRQIKILDPACGTGNFLYVALDLLKGLEAEVQTRLVDVAGNVQLNVLEQINPSQFLGIEINPRAAAIAELVIWIGYLQWFFKRYGNAEPPEPVLQAFNNIENRDAVLAYDGTEPDVDAKTGQVRTRWGGRMMPHPVTGEQVPDPSDQVVILKYLNARAAEWPEADYVVSNPPFIGNARMREALGDGYAEALRGIYPEVSEAVDYVMYWWHKAAEITRSSGINCFGLITTNSIRQSRLRSVIDFHCSQKNSLRLKFVIPDHPWTDEGAAVRIAMTVGERENLKLAQTSRLGDLISENNEGDPESVADNILIQWKNIGKIFSNLRAGADLSKAIPIRSNQNLSCQGVKLHGQGFLIGQDSIGNLEPEVIYPFMTGKGLINNTIESYVIDFLGLKEEQIVEEYPKAYQWIYDRVKPERDQNNRKVYREKWWIFGEPRASYRSAWKSVSKYISTTRTAKHRVFQFLSSNTISESGIVMIFLENAYHLGVLSSNLHLTWTLAQGSVLEDRPVYNHAFCFYTFPFPDPTPEQKQKIRDLGERLDAHRKSVQAAHPDITITGMYNLLEKLRAGQPFTDADRDYNNRALVSTLKQIHDDLDLAVLDAYGWPHDITDDQILENLVALNAQRAEEERNGHIRWLRPEYQAPDTLAGGAPTQGTLEGITTPEEPVVEPVEQQPWPTKPKDQLAAIRDLLRTTNGDWTVPQIAAQFTGKNTKKKLDAVTENLERLEWFGLVIAEARNGVNHWHYTDSAKAA